MKEIDKIAFIEIQEGKILSTKSKGKTKYYIPGGKREIGESDLETLSREVFEELSVIVLPDTAEYIGAFSAQSDGAKKGVNVVMRCYKAKYSGTLKASNEIEEIRWLSYNDFEIISEVDKKIFSFLKKNGELK
ncbi:MULTISPECIES: NUDIX hydrolase [Tenacibaculum]|uniref:NUDIX hydrolase n=1 Tax=Tenacibaculum TaxID=104267 RepID=UPI00089C12E8|nr:MULTISPECIES: NUDIX domain-containing protein [unclassified Tenacibaculum]RBW55755.1 NUDIX domain-containing protein [Tenacibaculum sp. E3R01]SEE62063.1 8-oxo-dGTP pyrophosphatase MutT, NUDIX family [Tenacibaculum sp. MAR_2010_89]